MFGTTADLGRRSGKSQVQILPRKHLKQSYLYIINVLSMLLNTCCFSPTSSPIYLVSMHGYFGRKHGSSMEIRTQAICFLEVENVYNVFNIY